MTEADAARQEIVGSDPQTILKRLCSLGEMQVVTRQGGIVHEQFGNFARVDPSADGLACAGDGHATLLSAGTVGQVVINRLGGSIAKPQPRVDFLDRGGEILISVLGPPDSVAFKVMLDGFDHRPLPDLAIPALPEASAVDEADASVAPLRAVANSGRAVTVEFGRPGVHSSWRGVVQDVMLGPRNINIIQPDFHLHLRGGTIADWARRDEADGTVEQRARDAQGRDLGLVLRGEAAAFA